MSNFILTCPHCAAERMTFDIFGRTAGSLERRMVNTAVKCRNCDRPVMLELVCQNSQVALGQELNVFDQLMSTNRSIEGEFFKIAVRYPKTPEPLIPPHLPSDVERAYLQGERNFTIQGCEEASATMYRRSLDVALKVAFPDQKGDLNKRILSLVQHGQLPESLGVWSHQVRVIGNDGAHDLEGVTRPELVACRNFVDVVLRYVFTYPFMVAERRDDPAAALPSVTS